MSFNLSKIIVSVATGFLFVCAFFTMPSCSDGSANGSFKVDSLVFERNWALSEPRENDRLGGRSRYEVAVDFPSKSDTASFSALSDSVMTWISSLLLPSSDKPILKRTLLLEHAADEFFGNCDNIQWAEDATISIKKTYEDGRFVTYEYSKYSYVGNSQRSYNVCGATFNKKSGTRILWENIDRTDELRKNITAEMKEVKGNLSDDQLCQLLTIPEADYTLASGAIALPLPHATPWLSNLGWVFTYQPGEIFDVKQGAPGCCLTADKVQMD